MKMQKCSYCSPAPSLPSTAVGPWMEPRNRAHQACHPGHALLLGFISFPSFRLCTSKGGMPPFANARTPTFLQVTSIYPSGFSLIITSREEECSLTTVPSPQVAICGILPGTQHVINTRVENKTKQNKI